MIQEMPEREEQSCVSKQLSYIFNTNLNNSNQLLDLLRLRTEKSVALGRGITNVEEEKGPQLSER